MSKAQDFMNAVWECRNNGADTEEKLVAAILTIAAENVISYTAQKVQNVVDIIFQKGDVAISTINR
jgi:hypothetical protein